jgi:hypothetical protein
LAVSTITAVSVAMITIVTAGAARAAGTASTVLETASVRRSIVYPAVIEFATLARGAAASRSLTVEAGATAGTFRIEVLGDDAPWFDLGNSGQRDTEVVVQARGRRVIPLRVQIPTDALHGPARAVVRVATSGGAAGGDSTSTGDGRSAAGLSIDTELSVHVVVEGEQRLAASVRSVSARAGTAGRPLEIATKLRNDSSVAVTPTITASLRRDGIVMADTASHDLRFDVGAAATVTSVLETTGMKPGRYDLIVDAAVNGQMLDTNSSSIELAAATIDGALVAVNVTGRTGPGHPIELTATVVNQSGSPTTALVSSRLMRDGRTVAMTSSEPRLIRNAGQHPVKLVLAGARSGRYQLVSTVTLNGVAQPAVITELDLRNRYRIPVEALAAGLGILVATTLLGAVLIRRARQ